MRETRRIQYRMSFFREMATLLGFDEARLSMGYSYINFNGEAVYLEGITALLRFGDEETTFKLKKGVLTVRGRDLTVSELRQGSALVRGFIESVGTEPMQGKQPAAQEKAGA